MNRGTGRCSRLVLVNGSSGTARCRKPQAPFTLSVGRTAPTEVEGCRLPLHGTALCRPTVRISSLILVREWSGTAACRKPQPPLTLRGSAKIASRRVPSRPASPGISASPRHATRYGFGLDLRAARTSAVPLGPALVADHLSGRRAKPDASRRVVSRGPRSRFSLSGSARIAVTNHHPVLPERIDDEVGAKSKGVAQGRTHEVFAAHCSQPHERRSTLRPDVAPRTLTAHA